MENFRIHCFIFWLVAMISCTTDEKKEALSSSIIEIKNPILNDSIKNYYARNLSQYSKGIVTLDFRERSDTSVFYISSILSSFGLEKHPPTHVGELEGRPFLIYTGLENQILMDSSFVGKVCRKVDPFLEKIPPSYNPVVWRIELVSDEVITSEVVN